jgi:hypothetical protein
MRLCPIWQGKIETTCTSPKFALFKKPSRIDGRKIRYRLLSSYRGWQPGANRRRRDIAMCVGWRSLKKLQRNRPRTFITGGQFDVITWCRESNLSPQLLSICEQDHALPHLRDPIESRIQQRIATNIPLILKHLGNFFRDILPPVIEYVRNVLNHYSQWGKSCNIPKIVNIEPGTRIVDKGLNVLVHFTELGPSNTCKRLARGPTHDHVKCVSNRTNAQLQRKLLGTSLRDISSPTVSGLVAVKVAAVRCRSVLIKLYGTSNLETRRRQAQ